MKLSACSMGTMHCLGSCASFPLILNFPLRLRHWSRNPIYGRGDHCCSGNAAIISTWPKDESPQVSCHTHSQQLQPSSDLVNHTLRSRTHAQDGRASARNLRPPRIVYDLRAKAETECLRLQRFEFIFILRLHHDFCLAHPFPLFEDRVQRHGESVGEGAVAGEGRVGALGCDFACAVALAVARR